MSPNAVLNQAKQLIVEKRYQEAYDLLTPLAGNPTADRWRAKLAEGLAEQQQTESSSTYTSNSTLQTAYTLQATEYPQVFETRAKRRHTCLTGIIVVISIGITIPLILFGLFLLQENDEISSVPIVGTSISEGQHTEWEYLRAEIGYFRIELSGAVDGYDVTSEDELAMDYIQELGADGWELVNVGYYETGSNNRFTAHEAFFFKRRVQANNSYPEVT